jgi:magnesium transporter
MISVTTFYFSHIIGKKVISPDGKTMGRLKDLVADLAFVRPKIIAAVVMFQDGLKTIDFPAFHITNVNDRYILTCKEIRSVDLQGLDVIHIANQLLNKKIVDMNKKETILVYDLKIALLNSEATVVAVDAGLQGRLRRLGIAGLVQKFLKVFDVSIANRLILWDNVEAVNFGQTGVGLSKSISNLDRFHPSDMADIIEDMDSNIQVELFSAMDTERAADVLEELETDTRENLLENLSSDKMADVLEIMPADEAADILDEVDEGRAEEILKKMDSEASGEVRELMGYEDYEVGSLMTTDYVSFREGDTVGDTLEALRKEKPESDMIYYLNIVSESGELKAVVSLRDFVVSSLDAKLGDIMNRDVVYVHDTDRIESLNDILSKYNLLAMPVVDSKKMLLGMVIINDVMFNLLHTKRKRLS